MIHSADSVIIIFTRTKLSNLFSWGNYLKLSHFVLKMLLRFDDGDTAVLDAVTYLLLLSTSVKALICTFEIGLLQHIETLVVTCWG